MSNAIVKGVALCLLLSASPVISQDKPSDVVTNSVGMRFVRVVPGKFRMGTPGPSPAEFQTYLERKRRAEALGQAAPPPPAGGMPAPDDSELPVHDVTISGELLFGVTEVTVAQWKQFMREDESIALTDDIELAFQAGEQAPMTRVSLDAIQKFVRWVNQKERTFQYRLPTEAEWEYACRAGTTTRWYWGDEIARAADFEQVDAAGEVHADVRPVAMKKPNPWGIFDMAANASEVCLDLFERYSAYPVVDPLAGGIASDVSVGARAVRGVSATVATSGQRAAVELPNERVGFRIVRDLSGVFVDNPAVPPGLRQWLRRVQFAGDQSIPHAEDCRGKVIIAYLISHSQAYANPDKPWSEQLVSSLKGIVTDVNGTRVGIVGVFESRGRGHQNMWIEGKYGLWPWSIAIDEKGAFEEMFPSAKAHAGKATMAVVFDAQGRLAGGVPLAEFAVSTAECTEINKLVAVAAGVQFVETHTKPVTPQMDLGPAVVAKRLPSPTQFVEPATMSLRTTESGLRYVILTDGTGASPTKTDRVVVNYSGWFEDGTLFDSSYSRGKPATFGLGEVISGLSEGLQLLKAGSKARFVIPANLGYGAAGAPPRIPPNALLVFFVELVEVGPMASSSGGGRPAGAIDPGADARLRAAEADYLAAKAAYDAESRRYVRDRDYADRMARMAGAIGAHIPPARPIDQGISDRYRAAEAEYLRVKRESGGR